MSVGASSHEEARQLRVALNARVMQRSLAVRVGDRVQQLFFAVRATWLMVIIVGQQGNKIRLRLLRYKGSKAYLQHRTLELNPNSNARLGKIVGYTVIRWPLGRVCTQKMRRTSKQGMHLFHLRSYFPTPSRGGRALSRRLSSRCGQPSVRRFRLLRWSHGPKTRGPAGLA